MPAIELNITNETLDADEWERVCNEVFQFIVDITPVDTGVCRDAWEFYWSPTDCRMYNPTEYASYLDEGWSNQAPNGMIQPALQYLRELLN